MSQSIPQPQRAAAAQTDGAHAAAPAPSHGAPQRASGQSSAQTSEYRSRFAEKNVGFGKLLVSEFRKIFSLASTYWLLGISLVVIVGMACLAAWSFNAFYDSSKSGIESSQGQLPPEAVAENAKMLNNIKEAARHTLVDGNFFGVLILASFAVVVIAGEYGTGMIRSTLTAAPKRWPALLAKTVVMAVVAAALSLCAYLISYVLANVILQSDLQYSLGDHNVLRATFMTALYVVLVCIMAFGFGLLLRNGAGGICTIIGILFVLPIVVAIASNVEWIQQAGRFLPSELGGIMGSLKDSAVNGDPGVGGSGSGKPFDIKPIEWNMAGVWLAVEALVIWATGMIVAQKRDV